MSDRFSTPIQFSNEEETAAFAGALAPHLMPGDTLLLSGPLGAGKSFFARALIQARLAAADRMEDVPSPTFTLVQTYWDGGTEIWHADLYRLSGPDEIVELGLEEAFETAICLVEWPERLGEDAPEAALCLRLDQGGEEMERRATFSGNLERWSDLLKQIETADSGACR